MTPVPDGRVEILLATRNSERFLAPLLHSLLEQVEDDFHLVVSDDVSTDGTLAVLAGFAPRFRNPVTIYRRDRPSGSAMANFSRLLEASTGDYVLLADHDDIWLPDKVGSAVSQLRALEIEVGRETPLLSHSDLAVVDAEGSRVHDSYWAFKQIVPAAGAELPSALLHATVTGCAAAVNRALVERAVPVPSEAIMHDWWLNLVAAGLGRVTWDPQPRVLYRIHGDNVSRPRPVSMPAALRQADRLSSLRRNWQRRYGQGAALRDRYADVLAPDRRESLDTFVRLRSAPPVARQVGLVRGGFLWPGVWRNVVQLPFA